MRTKTLLLTAALAAAGAASAMAQNVYSVNAVGYVNLSVPPGFSMIANTFVQADQNIATLIPAPPNQTTIYTVVGGVFNATIFDDSIPGWDPAPGDLALGSGGIAYNPTSSAFTITLVGEVKQGAPVPNSVPAGITIKSSMIPQAGGLSSALQFNPVNNTTVYQYVNDGVGNVTLIANIYDPTIPGWDPAEPVLRIGEAFFIDSASGETWNRNFSVN